MKDKIEELLLYCYKIDFGTERLSDRIQKIFIDLNKKLELFIIYKTKQDSLDELSKEMLKTLDALTIKIDHYV